MINRGRGLRGVLLAAAAGTLSLTAGAAMAQTGASSGADLRRQLTALADNPNSVAALIDAGRAALDLGDSAAALGFFTRAAELSPRDGRAKAGLAAANVHNGNALEALRLFQEARSLGLSDAAIAGDRGLAYDLLGQTARAQQDYVLSLSHREDAEVRRRLALSLAISGQRDAALRTIEGLVRSGDRASLRTRAFVLALSGDGVGASNAARAAMPAATASAMAPFLQRMANLSPVQMASAAHLGRFPASGGAFRTAGNATADPAAVAFAGGSASPLAGRLPVATPSSNSSPRRRPGVSETRVREASAAPAIRAVPSRTLASAARPPVSPARQPAFVQPHPHEPLAGARPAAAPTLRANVQAPVELAGVTTAAVQVPSATRPESAPAQPAPGLAVPDTNAWERIVAGRLATDGSVASTELAGAAPAQAEATPVRIAVAESAPVAVEASAATAGIDFADVAAAISALPVEAEERPTPQVSRAATSQTRRPATLPSSPATTARSTGNTVGQGRGPTRSGTTARNANGTSRATTRAQTPAQRHPARIWVQIATAARGALPGEFARLRRVAPEILRGRNAYTAPSGGSNGRLLVGPFATQTEARAFINRLNREDISSFAWSSTAGQEVAQLPAGR